MRTIHYRRAQQRKHSDKHIREVNNCHCVLCLNPRRNKFLKNKDRLTISERIFNSKGVAYLPPSIE